MKTEFGIYYYPWYNAKRWAQHPRKKTPLLGEYDSLDDTTIDNHLDLLLKLGIDYLIFEMLPFNDWAFEENFLATCKFVQKLKETPIKFTYLIDTAVGLGHQDSCSYLDSVLLKLEKENIFPTKSKNDKPFLLFFSTPLTEALTIQDKYNSHFTVNFPIFLPDWASCDDNCVRLLRERGSSISLGSPRCESLAAAGYTQFWAPPASALSLNNIFPIIPGYDDTLLQRDPQIAPIVNRDNGATLRAFFELLKKFEGVEEVIIYSWNEFFEDTAIEPTLDEGFLYYNLVKDLILELKENGGR